MPDPLSSLALSFLTGLSEELGHECIRRHSDDIQEVIDEGWQRDYEADGVSSWFHQDDEEVEPA